jgi:hypothetical protein
MALVAHVRYDAGVDSGAGTSRTRASNEGVKRRDHAESPVIKGSDRIGLYQAAGRQDWPRSVVHLRD